MLAEVNRYTAQTRHIILALVIGRIQHLASLLPELDDRLLESSSRKPSRYMLQEGEGIDEKLSKVCGLSRDYESFQCCLDERIALIFNVNTIVSESNQAPSQTANDHSLARVSGNRRENLLSEVFREVIRFLKQSKEESSCCFGDLRAITTNSRLAKFRMKNAPLMFPKQIE